MSSIYPSTTNARSMLMKSEDYPLWASYIQLRAVGLRILEYCNFLEKNYDDLKISVIPEQPAIGANTTTAATYKTEYDQYIEKMTNVAQVQQDILTTVDPNVLLRNDNTTVKSMLQGIRDYYSLDNEDKEVEIH